METSTNMGWIKLHRKIVDKGYYTKSHYVHLWVHLLLKANHKTKKFMWNGHEQTIKAGQFLTGRKQLSIETGISETTIERILRMLETEQQIGQQKTSKYRVITILNWEQYQQADSETDSKRTTNGQQTDTNKNEKNDKNEKKETWEELFDYWFQYKKERRESYKSTRSETVFKNHLKNLAKDDLEIANLIVQQSVANNWQGIFELRNAPQKSKYYTLINGKEVDVEPYQNYFNTETHPEDYAGKTAIGGVAMKKDIKQR